MGGRRGDVPYDDAGKEQVESSLPDPCCDRAPEGEGGGGSGRSLAFGWVGGWVEERSAGGLRGWMDWVEENEAV